VLHSVYGYAAESLARAFRAFAGLPSVTLEEPAPIARALEWMERGIDFADALHLTRAESCEAFISFDLQLAATAGRLGALPVRAP
jgi:hypothetical protein